MTVGKILVAAGGIVAFLAAFGVAIGGIALVPLALGLAFIGLALG